MTEEDDTQDTTSTPADGATDQPPAAPELSQRLPLANLLLLVPPNWNLHPLDATRILARRNPVGGILQIASVPRDRLPSEPSYDECLAHARQTFDPESLLASFDGSMRDTATGPLGVASFHKKNDFLRAIYCLRPVGLIFGVYSCAWDLRNKPDWQIGRVESESIIASAAFNRPLAPPPFPHTAPDQK